MAYLVLLALATVASVCDAWKAGIPSQPLTSRPVRRSQYAVAMAESDDSQFKFGDAGEVSAETAQAVAVEEEMTEKQKEIARLRAAEKFMKKDTGDAVCRTCGYQYKMETGDGVIPRNTPFQLLPDNYVCVNCKSPKAFFDPVQIEIAGFADNQQYGFGSNTWTESQKSTAIFGGLGLFFALLMSGYALN